MSARWRWNKRENIKKRRTTRKNKRERKGNRLLTMHSNHSTESYFILYWWWHNFFSFNFLTNFKFYHDFCEIKKYLNNELCNNIHLGYIPIISCVPGYDGNQFFNDFPWWRKRRRSSDPDDTIRLRCSLQNIGIYEGRFHFLANKKIKIKWQIV